MLILHYLKKGETLQGISNRYDIDLEELVKINNLSSYNLKNIESLYIPNKKVQFVVVRNAEKEELIEVDSSNLDRLADILKNKSIVEQSSADLGHGDKVIFKSGVVSYYIIKPLDNMTAVTSYFGVSKEHIMQKNNLKSDRFFIGQKIKI